MSQRPAPSGGSRTALWVVIAVAAVVLVGLVVWGLVGRGEAEPSPTPTDAATTPSTPTDPATDDPGGETTGATDPGDGQWGPMPPPNVDSLKPLDNPEALPEQVGPFVREEVTSNVGGASVFYDDPEAFRSISVNTSTGSHHYQEWVAALTDPAYHGNAVCGSYSFEGSDGIECIVAGTNATLKTGTADIDVITMEELAEFTNELHDQF